jgi:tetrahydromethanopterin S-methyltransferase subunit A
MDAGLMRIAPELSDEKIIECLKGNLSCMLPDRFTILNGRFIIERADPISDKKSTLFDKYGRDNLEKEGWPINPGYTYTSDPCIPTAVAMPTQQKELQDSISPIAAVVGSCTTPNEGPQIAIANLVANPNIRWLILAGKESGHFSGDVLKCANGKGIDWNSGRVINTASPTSPYFRFFRDMKEEGKKIMDRFGKQIEVVDLMDDNLTIPVLQLVTRMCMQEPSCPFRIMDTRTKEYHVLYDKGAYSEEGKIVEPIIIKVKKALSFEESEYKSRVGTAIFATDVIDAQKQLRDFTAQCGSYAEFESGIKGIDVVSVQVSIQNLNSKLIPPGYRPEKHLDSDELAEDYIKKYSTWVYLLPHSSIQYHEGNNTHIPVLPEKFDYVYGSQLCAWGWQQMSDDEKKEFNNLISQFQQQYKFDLPPFDRILEFHMELMKLKPYRDRRVVDQLYEVGLAGLKFNVENKIMGYRLYVSLQDPREHISADPRKLHPPCFAMYEWYPRMDYGKWRNDTIFLLRAHAEKAFPSNANGGIIINKFTAWNAGIEPGTYVHHSGCFQIYSDDLDKRFLEMRRKETLGE